MDRFYNNRGSCFAGSCLVAMANGTIKEVCEIIKGDSVKTCLGESKVVCVVRGTCLDNLNSLVELDGGLLITPYHPVRINNVW